MSKRFLGIDPGKKGAIALIDQGPVDPTFQVWDMPGTTHELHSLIASLPPVKICTLEKLFTGPAMSSRAVATMFEAYGTLKGALAWKDIPVKEVQPNKWKPALGLSKDKNASREMAMQRLPLHADLFKRVKDDGRAEAALLALYGAGDI